MKTRKVSRSWLWLAAALLFPVMVQAQLKATHTHGIRPGAAVKNSTGYSGTGSNIDVLYHRVNWRIVPDSLSGTTNVGRSISGNITTYFKVISTAGLSTLTFDLNKASFNNANLKVFYRGVQRPLAAVTFPATGNVNILQIALGTTLAPGQVDSVTIHYKGRPPASSGAAEGFQVTTDPTSNQRYVYTLSESYEDRDWWPCKADMQDKIDSMDINVSVPWTGRDTFWVATNGKLMDSAISGTSRTFRYKNRYPMASYLVSLGVGRYNRYYTQVNVGGTNVPVAYYLLRGKSSATYNNIRTAMNNMNTVLVELSKRWGDYPFKNEKHGFYEGLGGAGGMEHQTFSAIASSALTSQATLAHELVHQWFGDKVTFGTWNNLWLAEGFAKYGEALAAELVPAMGINPVTHRGAMKSTALSTATTPVYLSAASIASSNTIWTANNDNAVYQRGAMIVSMLRKMAGDNLFHTALRNYLTDPALSYRSATTEDLKNHFEAVLGYDLDPFFNDYVYGTGNPRYAIEWGNVGGRINIKLAAQTKSTGSTVAYFRTPVVLRILDAAGTKDTSVVLYDQNGLVSYAGNGISAARVGNVLAYQLSFTPASVVMDPFNETMVANTGTVTKVAALNNTDYALLPVDIVSFAVQPTKSGNELQLLVAATDTNRIAIAQRSVDGVSFTDLGRMFTYDPSALKAVYHFTDFEALQYNRVFYRAKTIDELGHVKHSTVIGVPRETVGRLSVYPNPAKRTVYLAMPRQSGRKWVRVQLYDIQGNLVQSRFWNTPPEIMEWRLQQPLPGSYQCVVVDNLNQRYSQLVVIQP